MYAALPRRLFTRQHGRLRLRGSEVAGQDPYTREERCAQIVPGYPTGSHFSASICTLVRKGKGA